MSPSSASSPERWSPLPDDPAEHSVLAVIDEHFGVSPEVFAGHRLWRHKRGTIWLTSRGISLETLGALARIEAIGLRVRRNDAHASQFSVAFMRRFFASASRHTLRLPDETAVSSFWARERRLLSTLGATSGEEGDGYYVVFGPRGRVLGRARVSRGHYEPELPRSDRPPMLP